MGSIQGAHSQDPGEGCDGKSHGIACCEYVEPEQNVFFTDGDNVAKKEKFIQRREWVGSCRNSCKIRYPASTGITESKTQKYHPDKLYFKCWCEFGTAQLDRRNTAYKTCVFSEKEPLKTDQRTKEKT